MTDTGREVGAAIRRRREARGLSCHQLARLTGIDASMLSKVERGVVETTLERYRAIAGALGVPMASLFRMRAA
jgi:transcriptional regulator with XRE-family HTH domain